MVDAADTARITAVAVNRYGEETRTGVTFTGCNNNITVAVDPQRVNLEAPDRAIVVGNTLGPSCVTISGGGFSEEVGVAVVAADLVVTAAPDVLRAGETGEVVVTTVDAVGPFARTDVTYSSDDDAVVAVTDDMGSISTSESGAANITATWTGEAGVTRQVTHGIGVVANVPVGVSSNSVNVIITVFGEGIGVADITGTVTTSEGDLAFGPADVTVNDPGE